MVVAKEVKGGTGVEKRGERGNPAGMRLTLTEGPFADHGHFQGAKRLQIWSFATTNCDC